VEFYSNKLSFSNSASHTLSTWYCLDIMRSSAVFVLLALFAISSAFKVYNGHRDFAKRTMKTRELSQACIEILQPCFAMTPDFGLDDPNLLQKSCEASMAFYRCLETSGQFCDGNELQSTLDQLKQHMEGHCPQWSGLKLRKTVGDYLTILGVSKIADKVDSLIHHRLSVVQSSLLRIKT